MYLVSGGASPRNFTSLRLMHPLKADEPMLATLAGIVTEVNHMQPAKALLPMTLIESGIMTLVICMLRKKALLAIS